MYVPSEHFIGRQLIDDVKYVPSEHLVGSPIGTFGKYNV